MMFTGWYDRNKRPTNQAGGPILTAQIDWELSQLVRIYRDNSPRNVLEIGSQSGGTLWHWLKYASQGARLMNIDILQNQTPNEAEKLPARWQSWVPEWATLRTVIARSDDPETVKAVVGYFPEGIDFLFIDACHTYEGAKHDFMQYGPLVVASGIIALHDLMTPNNAAQQHIQVGKLWREIQAAGYKTQELRAASSAPWGGIGVVYV